MTITHIFFDLHGTLIDSAQLHPCYSDGVGRAMAAQYGGRPEAWAAVHRQIVAEWDAYYADLNLSGDDGLRDMQEGMYRTTRALFTLSGFPEPPPEEIKTLAQYLPGIAPESCPALYPDVLPALQQLFAAGYQLGVASHALSNQARGILRGSAIEHFFAAPIMGPDITEEFEKNAAFYACIVRLTAVPPDQCLIVDDHIKAIQGAQAAGMRGVLLQRDSAVETPDGIMSLHHLSALAIRLEKL